MFASGNPFSFFCLCSAVTCGLPARRLCGSRDSAGFHDNLITCSFSPENSLELKECVPRRPHLHGADRAGSALGPAQAQDGSFLAFLCAKSLLEMPAPGSCPLVSVALG